MTIGRPLPSAFRGSSRGPSVGGASETCALKAGSPAIDFGLDASYPSTDQRDMARVDVPGTGVRTCDSGAFEFQPGP